MTAVAAPEGFKILRIEDAETHLVRYRFGMDLYVDLVITESGDADKEYRNATMRMGLGEFIHRVQELCEEWE